MHRNSACKHCIIKYLKSTFYVSLIIGKLPLTRSYPILTMLQKQSDEQFKRTKSIFLVKKDSFGFNLDFQGNDRVCKITSDQQRSIKLQIPLIILCSDTGYFKQNVTLHMTKSLNNIDDENSDFIQIQPSYLVKTDYLLSKLEEKHIFYVNSIDD